MVVSIYFVLVLGLGCGLAIVLLIRARRRRPTIDSLVALEQLIGATGIVVIPFNRYSQGKIRLTVQGGELHLTAFTDESQTLEPCDLIVVIAVRRNRVWVIPERDFWAYNRHPTHR